MMTGLTFFFYISTTITAATPRLTRNSLNNTEPFRHHQDNITLANEFFHWEDYSVLAFMLIVSCGIGVFYGFFGEKQTTGDDFLLGGSSMGTCPMALSLAAR